MVWLTGARRRERLKPSSIHASVVRHASPPTVIGGGDHLPSPSKSTTEEPTIGGPAAYKLKLGDRKKRIVDVKLNDCNGD